MAGLVPAIHGLFFLEEHRLPAGHAKAWPSPEVDTCRVKKVVDGRHKAGHDDLEK
jgi:hypothetical protein